MSIENLRWYHWLPIGLALGAIIGCVRLASRGNLEDAPIRTIGRADLAQGLSDGRPSVSDLVVHPPRGDGVWWVTGLRVSALRLHTDPRNANSPIEDAEVQAPFKLRVENASIWDELQRAHAVARQTAPSPSYAWDELTISQMLIWMLGTGAIVGVVWPPLLMFLIGAGFSRRPIEPSVDLPAFSSEEPAAPASAMATQDTVALDALIEQLASDDRPPAEPTAANPSPAPVQTFASQPLDPPPAAVPEEPKDYAGQFYPTQAHAPRRRS